MPTNKEIPKLTKINNIVATINYYENWEKVNNQPCFIGRYKDNTKMRIITELQNHLASIINNEPKDDRAIEINNVEIVNNLKDLNQHYDDVRDANNANLNKAETKR